MKFGPVKLAEAEGKILAHNIMGEDGHKRFGKGRTLIASDLEVLDRLGYSTIIVAALGPHDLSENAAALRVGQAIVGPHIHVVAPGVGRATLLAEAHGPLVINVPALANLNNIDPGITIATLREHTLVNVHQLVSLVKIIPFGIPAARVEDIEAITNEVGPIIAVRPLMTRSAGLIISGPESARKRLTADFVGSVRSRLESLDSNLSDVSYVAHQPEAIATAIQTQLQAGRELIIVTSVSAIIDMDDVVPTALQIAGGAITHFGVPVDPGSLLMLGYVGNVPVLGAPGCIKSLKTNIVDWVLPRLLAGERLTRADLVVMGHGGLLEDIHERPMPRHITED